MSLIRQRGYYNATMTDVRIAKGMARGEAYISDGGERLRNSYEIKCATYLYRLVWNEETADKFYSALYSEVPDVQKLSAFNTDTSTFRLVYVGCSEQVYKQERDKVITSNGALVKTAMAEIIDMDLASLQDICPSFRVKEDVQNILYNVIRIVKLSKGKIGDNRFNAYDSSGKEGKGLIYTKFDKISGDDFYYGLLIRKKSGEIQNS